MSSSQAKLSEVALINPRRPRIERPNEWPTSFVPMEAVDETSGEVIASIARPYSAVKKGYTYFGDGDVIFAKIAPCMQNGKHAVIRGLLDGIGFGSTEFHVIRPSKSVIPEWVHYFLRRKETLNAAARTFTGTVGQQRVPPSFLESIEIPVPPLDEQRRIATRLKAQLAEVETARQAAQVQVQDVAMLRSRVLNDAFANLNDLPLTPLADVADIAAGITLGRKTNGFELIEVPYLRVANVQDGHLTLGEIKTVAATGREIEKWTLQDGDLLLTEGGDLDKLGRGACWRNQIPRCIHQNHIFRVRLPKDRYDPDFASFQICSQYGKAYFLAHAKKTTGIASINQRVLGAFPLISPPLDRQRQIASRLEAQLADVEAARQALEAQQVELAALPQRLLSQAFKN